MTISGCVLVKNEAERLPHCLENIASYVEEIIVVDNGSTDDSYNIAKNFGCKVIYLPDTNFDAARNAYLEVATEPWILVLDADERFDADIGELQQTLKDFSPQVMGLLSPRFDYYGKGRWSSITLIRLFRNDSRIRYNKLSLHSTVLLSIREMGGEFGMVHFPIHHLDMFYSGRVAKKSERNIALLLSEIKKNPSDARLRDFLALEYMAVSKFDIAEKELKEAIRLDPNDLYPRSHLFLAYLYLLQNNLPSANHEAVKVSNDSRFRSGAAVVLAEIANRQGDKDKALQICNLDLEYNPLLPHMHINIASLLQHIDPTKAIEHLNQAIKLNKWLLKPIIYKNIKIPNIYQPLPALLSCVQTVPDHMETCWRNLENEKLALEWKKKATEIDMVVENNDEVYLFESIA